MILERLECKILLCVHASTLSTVDPPNSTRRKGVENRRGEDATSDILPSQKLSLVQVESSLITNRMTVSSRKSGDKAFRIMMSFFSKTLEAINGFGPVVIVVSKVVLFVNVIIWYFLASKDLEI